MEPEARVPNDGGSSRYLAELASMPRGRWGGRAPLVNLVSSAMIRAAVRWRLVSRRVVNQLRPLKPLKNSDPQAASLQFARWRAAGYEKLNIGGGPKNLAGFVNIDFVSHDAVEREIVADITDLSFIPDSCVSHVHSNHVIEHLTRDQLEDLLTQFKRILRPSGLLTIRCPNALGVAYGFWFHPQIEDEREKFVGLGFPADEDFGNPKDGWMYQDLFGFLHWIYGDPGNLANEHRQRLTPTTLSRLLTERGFNVAAMTAPEAVNLVVVATPSTRENKT